MRFTHITLELGHGGIGVMLVLIKEMSRPTDCEGKHGIKFITQNGESQNLCTDRSTPLAYILENEPSSGLSLD